MRDDFVFFWGNSPFSNWEPTPFTFNDVDYNCSEQYMMHQKALLFNDIEIANEIMATDSPRLQKALGREVRGFNKEKWLSVCEEIMIPALVAKFISTLELKEFILNTGDKEIVEASPYDRIWGIGLDENNSLAWNKSTWKGLNLLGKVLMEARSVIRKL
jgi:ribA/ribD-fused uncharacterized protein